MRWGAWIVGVAASTVVWGEPCLPVKTLKLHRTALGGRFVVDVSYPQIDLFGADAYAKLDPLVGLGAAAEMGEKEPVAVTEHTYHCYLGSRGVTFYQIFDNFAAGSVQVCLPYAQALPLASPGGPLKRLK